MKTVLLISPHRWKPACTPHALEHLAHYLHGAGFKPVIIDCNATAAPFQKILKVISEEKPLLIGITVRNLGSAFLSPKPVYFPP
ncbi:MAG: hypothetical protein GY754_42830, partial [bacterium]|nr:hypothetical protein [bacterium]